MTADSPDGSGRPELLAAPTLLGAARRDVAGVAGFAQERDGRGAHAASAAVHQGRRPRRDRSQTRHEEVRERREKDLRERAGLIVSQVRRDRQL